MRWVDTSPHLPNHRIQKDLKTKRIFTISPGLETFVMLFPLFGINISKFCCRTQWGPLRYCPLYQNSTSKQYLSLSLSEICKVVVWKKCGPKGLVKELYTSVTTSICSFYHKNKNIRYVIMTITVWWSHNVIALVALLILCPLPVSMHRCEHSGEFTWPPYSLLSGTHFLAAPSPSHRRDWSKPQPPRGWVLHYPLVLLPYKSCADLSYTHTHTCTRTRTHAWCSGLHVQPCFRGAGKGRGKFSLQVPSENLDNREETFEISLSHFLELPHMSEDQDHQKWPVDLINVL